MSSPADWRADKRWADRHFQEIERVVRSLVSRIVSIKAADDYQDQRQATDYIIRVDAGEIACRVRNESALRRYRDFTLRYKRESGANTEWRKIRDGHARWYLYAWADATAQFVDWVFVDLDVVRAHGLIDDGRELVTKPNGDGTYFRAYDLKPFGLAGAIMATTMQDLQQPAQQPTRPPAQLTLGGV